MEKTPVKPYRAHDQTTPGRWPKTRRLVFHVERKSRRPDARDGRGGSTRKTQTSAVRSAMLTETGTRYAPPPKGSPPGSAWLPVVGEGGD